MSTHTPGPWRVAAWNPTTICVQMRCIASVRDLCIESQFDEDVANAAHIVKCVNSHDALLAACKAAEPVFADAVPACIAARIPGWQKLSDVRDKLRDAVKLAEGQG